MNEIKTEIEIKASPEAVWSVLKDVDGWQNWSPVINKSKGTVAVGNSLDITMCSKQEGKDGPRYQPKIIELEEGKSLRWRAHMLAGFIFTNDKLLELEEIPGGTRLIHKELFSGLMWSMMKSQMKKGVPPILQSMNEALKEKIEKGA